MLQVWIPHSQYQEKLYINMLIQYEIQRSRVVDLNKSISKLYLLNLDNLLPVIKLVYIKPDFDPGMFSPVPRNSETFKSKFKTRTSIERSNKRMFEDYAIEYYESGSSMMRAALATFAVVNIHLDVWIKHTGFSFIDIIKEQSA